ncbi:MAG: hypothetical protein Q9N62_07615 [Ghiorsea sp.]|nr:hypothetical protein [Ghiorsea sp.]
MVLTNSNQDFKNKRINEMKINIKNTNVLSAEIAKTEGKSRKRTMQASQVIALIQQVEATLSIIAPKKEWVGSEFTSDHREHGGIFILWSSYGDICFNQTFPIRLVCDWN